MITDQTFSFNHRAVAGLQGTGTLAIPTLRYQPTFSGSLSYGTGTGKADQAYGKSTTIQPGQHDIYDLVGVMDDGFGGIINIRHLKYIEIANENDVGEDATLLFGAPAATNEYFELGAEYGANPHEFYVVAGGYECKFNPVGWAAVDHISDYLWVYNTGSIPIQYTILLVGSSI